MKLMELLTEIGSGYHHFNHHNNPSPVHKLNPPPFNAGKKPRANKCAVCGREQFSGDTGPLRHFVVLQGYSPQKQMTLCRRDYDKLMKDEHTFAIAEAGEREQASIEKSRGEKIRLAQKQKDLTRQKKMYKGNPEQRAMLGKQVSTIQGKKSDLTLSILKDKEKLNAEKKAHKMESVIKEGQDNKYTLIVSKKSPSMTSWVTRSGGATYMVHTPQCPTAQSDRKKLTDNGSRGVVQVEDIVGPTAKEAVHDWFYESPFTDKSVVNKVQYHNCIKKS